MATKLIFTFHKVQHLLGDHKWILNLNQKIVCQNMSHLSQVNVLSYKVLPKVYIYIYIHIYRFCRNSSKLYQQPYEVVWNPCGGD
jgi:hypothetical protein